MGVRQLRDHLNEVLREVRDERLSVDVTLHGQVVAELRPTRSDPGLTRGLSAPSGPPDELHLRWREEMRRLAATPLLVDAEEAQHREEELDHLAQRIGQRWPKGLSAVEALRRDRDAE